MPMAETDIQPGKCYATGAARTTKCCISTEASSPIKPGQGREAATAAHHAGVKAFAAAVIKEIACPAEG